MLSPALTCKGVEGETTVFWTSRGRLLASGLLGFPVKLRLKVLGVSDPDFIVTV